jgi:hypothetical protein
MVTFLAFIGFTTILGLLVGAILWLRWSSGGPKAITLTEQQLGILEISASEAYGPVSRLFADRDFQFLAGQAGSRPKMVKRLRRARWQVLRSYLSELRADFRQALLIGRVLAVQSENPSLAAFVNRQAVRFYVQLSLVEIYCLLRRPSHVQREVAGLASALDRLRQTTRALLVAGPLPHFVTG